MLEVQVDVKVKPVYPGSWLRSGPEQSGPDRASDPGSRFSAETSPARRDASRLPQFPAMRRRASAIDKLGRLWITLPPRRGAISSVTSLTCCPEEG